MIKKTLIPQSTAIYSSFPTFAEHKGILYFFYREGIKNSSQPHGINGKVYRCKYDKTDFLQAFNNPSEDTIPLSKTKELVFESENELDAILSSLEEDSLFSLCTRTYVENKIGKTYVSFSDKPHFNDRYEVTIKGIQWLVFYGRAFKENNRYIFPAYGILEGENITRPLLLSTDDLHRWTLLSYIKSPSDKVILNENSIARVNEKFLMFIRQDNSPYGIWHCESNDLINWSKPLKLLSHAHAPSAYVFDNNLYISYRALVDSHTSKISMLTTNVHSSMVSLKYDISLIDTYKGNAFDGGYACINALDGDVYVLYYLGNINGEPSIKIARY
ncbi:hypothetical protein MCHI_001541 [Candidatus Magnetoovum chiemensis]|nr:hypothetical protein MCHI_001541 [Candidatus Magnetoovum chiemensis]